MTDRAALVKICGIRSEETLVAMNGLPVDYIGFMFAAGSKRLVTPELAGKLGEAARAIPMRDGKPPLSVGVFVNSTLEQIEETVAVAKLDVVQLHGSETPDFCREAGKRLGIDIWRALSVTESANGVERLAAYEGAVSTILLDTAGGGTGQLFDWGQIPAYRSEAAKHHLRLFVAGGLKPDNVGELTKQYNPDGVDVSSGVETDGSKDTDKIAAFAKEVAKS